ncbi:unnamed protein product [Mesocestoides corti]|uniref:RRM domain-containing protein n=1 Tax=Mesocestoides corti TaxID=53468 RepID=A0A0R3ULD8_MESCO|nr:unnamed protein product [Mesocestoides corti]
MSLLPNFYFPSVQTSVNVQPSDFTTRYVDPEGVPIPNAGQALLGGSSNAPKFGTLIPNRIFVGGIPSNTTEQELKTYFSSFGQVKDVKIINDRLGVSKGSYGFVTFESQEVAEKIIKNESETLIFKDRKLNIGHAIRKQQLFPRPADVPPALFFAGGAIPCGFQSGLPVFPLTGQDYSGLLAQPGSAYQQMLLQQANGAVYLSPQANHAAAAAQYSAALQSHLAAAAAAAAAQPNAATAAAFATLQHHQQYQQASLTGELLASPPPPKPPQALTKHAFPPFSSIVGPLAAATAGGQTSPAAVMAAAAAAVAAASQWSNATNTTANGHQSSPALPAPPQLTPTPSVSVSQHSSAALGGVLDAQSPQVAALAAAVAAQQQLAAAAWRWPAPQQNGGAVMPPSASTSTNGSTGQQQQPQQVSTGLYENLSWFYQQPPPPPAPPTSTTESFRLDPAVVASFAAALTANCQASGDTSTDEAHYPLSRFAPPPLLLHSPHIHHDLHQPPQQLVFLPTQATFASNATTTSDYSTDHSAHSSGLLETVEIWPLFLSLAYLTLQPGIFHCDGIMSPQQPIQHPQTSSSTLANVYTPAVFEGGIAAASSPAIANNHLVPPPTQQLISQKLFSTTHTNSAGQTSQQGSQTPHLYGTPTPQPIILDVYPGNIPLAPMKQGLILSAENLMGAQVDHNAASAGVCMKQNGAGNRGGTAASPKKLATVNGTGNSGGRAI